VDAAKQWAEGVMMGTTAPGDVPPPGIVAYHGSPADFNRFDDRFIGTGEGAQAYGRGHYFGGAEETGRSYRDALTPETIPNPEFNAAQHDYNAKYGAVGNAAGATDAEFNAAIADRDAAHEKMKSLPPTIPNPAFPGHMYEVNIGADPEHFLDWDKPLSEQSQHVQDALKASNVNPNDTVAAILQRAYRNPMHGGDLVGQPTATPAEVTDALAQRGIPGIRYLDQGSRAARDPIKLVQGKPYDPSDPTHIASHAMDMASGDRTAAAAIADRHAQLRAAEGDTAGANAMRQASTLLQSPRTIPPMTEGQPPGTHNYVVFSDDVISILKKYGLAGLMLGAGGAAAPYASGAPAQQ
jgi:hypothetical protein